MSPHRAAPEKKKSQSTVSWVVVAAVVIVAILVIGVLASTLTQPAPSPASKTKGDAQARLAIVEYSDFQ